MATSLAFHIIFAAIGIGMPALMVLAEWHWLRTGDRLALQLARRWAKGTAILFAVGAVSGTVLSFELGLLWPGFMAFAGAIIGMPFSLEGFAFFTEAIFLGIYLYGWDRISPRAHLRAGILVAVSGAVSGIFVVIANAWMNTPTGFTIVAGVPTDINPIAAMVNPAAIPQALHMTLAAYAATAFGAAGVHAWLTPPRASPPLSSPRAPAIALQLGVPMALLLPFSGDFAARQVADLQPAKLAAMEAHFTTEGRASLLIGGWPDVAAREVRFGIAIPGGLSWLVHGDADRSVAGLDQVPEADWPNVPVTHLAFQLMIALGSYLAVVAAAVAVLAIRRRQAADHRWLRWALTAATPMGFLAIESGWVVTEVGRQPWIVQGVLRTT